ncbi:putative acyltransferase 3 [Ahrensia sp. R2A130]|nr:putative acyltransferase 3 [Ahrensia sp. R2A130]
MITAYPVAVGSAIATYTLLIAMCWPRWMAFGTGRKWHGASVRAFIAHPVKPTQHYLPGFDFMRGFAAMLVAAGHLWHFNYYATYPAQLTVPQLGYAAKGVPMFVMLSGFLIYRSVLGIKNISSLKTYFWRRLFRIYPAYLVSVALTVFMGQLDGSRFAMDSVSFFFSELFAMRALGASGFANPVTWSLYVEMIFYILLPAFVALVGRRCMVPAAIIGGLVFILGDGGVSREVSLWKFFFFGILVSELALRDREKVDAGEAGIFHQYILIGMLLLGTIWLWFDLRGPVFDIFGNVLEPLKDGANYTIGLGVAYSLIMLSLARLPQVGRILDIFFLRYLGVISYSVFLIHPFYMVANFPGLDLINFQSQVEMWKEWPTMPSWFFFFVYLTGLLIWSTMVFLLVEKPALKWGNIWIKRRAPIWARENIGGIQIKEPAKAKVAIEPSTNGPPERPAF